MKRVLPLAFLCEVLFAVAGSLLSPAVALHAVLTIWCFVIILRPEASAADPPREEGATP